MLEKSDQGAAGRHHDMAGAVKDGWLSGVLLLHKVLGVPVVEEHRWVVHHNLKKKPAKKITNPMVHKVLGVSVV